jgi:histidinol dehydrogenase
VAAELATLPRGAIAGESWRRHGAVILVRDWVEAQALTNRLAPEHLQILLPDPKSWFAGIRHAGAAFLGRWCPEALGDYVAGPNHVLPTGRTARFASGLSVFDFLKRTTWVEASAEGLATVGPAAVALAEAEGLQAHGLSISLRLPAATGPATP